MQAIKGLSIRTVILLIVTVLAITLCFTGTARAALSYFSPDYQADFQTSNLEVRLSENGNEVEGNDKLLTWMTDNPKVGWNYDENLAAVNSGGYDEYVRVVVKKYWTDSEGNKVNTLNPELIQPTLNGTELKDLKGSWVADPAVTTPEQVILYSTAPVASGNSLVFADHLRIDPSVVGEAAKTTTESKQDGKTIFTTVYDINGMKFNVEAEVDAVQDHSYQKAIQSAWGIDPVRLGIGQ